MVLAGAWVPIRTVAPATAVPSASCVFTVTVCRVGVVGVVPAGAFTSFTVALVVSFSLIVTSTLAGS